MYLSLLLSSPAPTAAPFEPLALVSVIAGLIAIIMGNPWVFVGMAASGLNIAILAPIGLLIAMVAGIVSLARVKKNPDRWRMPRLAWVGLALAGGTVLLWLVAWGLSAI